MLASSLELTHFDKTQPGVALTGSNRSPASWHYVALLDAWCGLHAPISSAYLCPWVLSLPAPPAKRLHWCVLNKTLRCRSARDSPTIYVTFMTFTFRKGYRGPGSFLAAEAALPICVMIWDEFQLLESCIKKTKTERSLWQKRQPCCSLFSLEICHRWLSSCTQPRK